ncbi:hypothetical protein CEXT_249851 [Caerostris extrusa]|uniref:Uncharacterized protein n=1 Tax=Caerostris extrusa TaxID=172846 RepID=A0AAV4W6Z6_CAEEX|nr:hypothetical protein CEXT_249851 [Caerostris extrusa]
MTYIDSFFRQFRVFIGGSRDDLVSVLPPSLIVPEQNGASPEKVPQKKAMFWMARLDNNKVGGLWCGRSYRQHSRNLA